MQFVVGFINVDYSVLVQREDDTRIRLSSSSCARVAAVSTAASYTRGDRDLLVETAIVAVEKGVCCLGRIGRL